MDYVILEKNCYGYEDGGCQISNVIGPFDEATANAEAERLNALDHYAVEFEVVKLRPKSNW